MFMSVMQEKLGKIRGQEVKMWSGVAKCKTHFFFVSLFVCLAFCFVFVHTAAEPPTTATLPTTPSPTAPTSDQTCKSIQGCKGFSLNKIIFIWFGHKIQLIISKAYITHTCAHTPTQSTEYLSFILSLYAFL